MVNLNDFRCENCDCLLTRHEIERNNIYCDKCFIRKKNDEYKGSIEKYGVKPEDKIDVVTRSFIIGVAGEDLKCGDYISFRGDGKMYRYITKNGTLNDK